MIQRIQSIWLFLAALTLILMMFLPILNKEINGLSLPILYTRGIAASWDTGEFLAINIKPIYPLFITNIAVSVMAFANIFNFRKRTLQKRTAILNIVFIGGFAFWCSVYAQKVPGGINGTSFGIGAYLPAVAILFLVLAIFGINKDEKLIRSAERLR